MSLQPFYKSVLVGVDPKGLAAQAVIQGYLLAEQLGLKLHLALAVEVPPAMWPGIDEAQLAELHAATLQRAKSRAIEILEPALLQRHIVCDLARELVVYPGQAAKTLLKESKALEADMILIGHHEKRSFLDFGSTARAVFSHAKVPVWTQGSEPGPIKQILLPIDFSETSDLAARHALCLAKAFKASIRTIHCFLPPDFAMGNSHTGIPGPTYVIDQVRDAEKQQLESWMAAFPWGGVQASSRFVEDDPVRSIAEEAADHDLVVMGTHGRTGLARFLLGGVAYDVHKLVNTPILAIPGPGGNWLIDD